ncbi:MAG: hypothetical protein CSB55_03485 [Candidatus Cloacimonadota bacterium]|nr:MAG: hypothetical protein CSB55_03485 [Candidatus Cloacimonadota bacterium]
MFYSVKSNHKLIRPLPFDYSGMLSISNDVEGFGFSALKSFLKLINGRDETEWGKGFGLELSSSFFFYTENKNNFAYFRECRADSPESDFCDDLKELIRKGYIDTMHNTGDFLKPDSLTPGMLKNIVDEIKKNKLILPVFVNHGGTSNVSNIGNLDYHRGDDPNSRYYIGEILKVAGVKYFWSDMFYDNRDFWHYYDSLKYGIPRKSVFDWKLKDGSKLIGFRRYRNTERGPDHTVLGKQLQKINWRKFYAKNGDVSVYQHLAYIRDKDNVKFLEKKYFDKELRKPWEFLKKESDSGRLLILTQRRRLDYLYMMKNIKIKKKGNSVFLSSLPDCRHDLNYEGLTLLDSEIKKIICKDKEVEFVKYKDKIYVPFTEMEKI